MRISLALLVVAALFVSCSTSRPISSPSPDPTRSTLVSDRSEGVIANGADDAVITATILNGQGQPLSGVHVAITATGGGVLLTTPAVTDASGRTTARLTATSAGLKVVSAAVVGGATLLHTLSITFVAGPGAKLSFTVPPSNAQAGTTIAPPVVLSVEDAFGNLIADAGSTISLGLGQDGGSGALGGNTSISASNGLATFPDLSIAQAGRGYALVASSTGLASAISPTFDVTTGPPASLSFSVQPSGVVNGLPIAPAVQVALNDALGNLDASATAMVTLSLGAGCANASGPAQLSGTVSVAAVAGLATFADLSIDRAARGCTLTATASGFGGATSAAFDVNPGAPCAAQSTLIATPERARADGLAAISFAVTVRDCAGDLLSGEPVTLSATGQANNWNAASGATDVNGSFTAALSSKNAQDKTITATVATGSLAFALSTLVTFTPGAPSSSTSTIDATPREIVADGSANTSVIVIARDLDGNLFPDAQIELSATGSDNRWSADGLDGGAANVGRTGSDGSFSVRLSSTRAETKLISAHLTTNAGSATLSTAVTFIPGAPSAARTVLLASPTQLPADGIATSTLLLVASDANGNPLPETPVSFGATGGGTSFASASGSTSASGSYSTTLSATQAGLKAVSATVGSGNSAVVVTTNITFLSTAPVLALATIAANPTTLIADGSASTSITVTLSDATGAGLAGQLVTLGTSGSANTFTSGSISGSSASGITGADGTLTVTLSSTKAETKSITATAGGLSASTSVTFMAGAPSLGASLFLASPTTVTADGTSKSSLFLFANDAFGNPINGLATSFSASGSANTLSGANGHTNESGQFSATIASTRAETKTLTAALGAGLSAINLGASVTFVPAATQPLVTISSSASSVPADGTTTTLSVKVTDVNGNALNHQTVTLLASGSGNTLTSATGSTNASGIFTATLSSTRAEAKIITATVGATSNACAVTFFAGAPSAARSVLLASPTQLLADGIATSTLLLLASDANGNAVAEIPVSLSASGSSNSFATASGSTTASGSFSTTLSSTQAGIKTVGATVGTGGSAIVVTGSVTFLSTAPVLSLATISASPTTLVADGSATTRIIVTLKDASDIGLAGVQVALGSSGSGSSFTAGSLAGSSASGVTGADGTFTATLSSTKAETKSITASAGALSASTNVTFIAGPPSLSNSLFLASPTTVTADGTSSSTLFLLASDAFGNPISGLATAFSATGSANVLGLSSGHTNASGEFSTTISSAHAETKALTAALGADGSAITLHASVTFVPASTQPLVGISSSAQTVLADGTTATLSVKVTDANGNALTNQTVTLSSTGSGNTLTPSSGTTDDNGNFTATISSTKAEAKVITATVGTTSSSCAVTFIPGPASAARSSITATPSSVQAGATLSLLVLLADAQGNPVSGQTLTLSADGSANSFTTHGSSAATATGTTDPSGLFIATLTSSAVQRENVTATLSGASSALLGTPVTFAPNANSLQLALAVSPGTRVADGVTTAALTLTVTDPLGAPVTGMPVTLAATGSHNNLGGTNSGSIAGVTNSSGVYATTLSSTKAETKVITAAAEASSAVSTATFIAGEPDAAHSALVASSTNSPAIADGVETFSLSLVAADAFGNPCASQLVFIVGPSSGFNNTFAPGFLSSVSAEGITDLNGHFLASIATTTAGTQLMTAKVDNTTLTATVAFVAGPPSALCVNDGGSGPSSGCTTLTWTNSGTVLIADGISEASLLLLVRDRFGNPLASQPVSFAAYSVADGGIDHGATFLAPSTTDSSGDLSATLASTQAGTEQVTATIGVNPATLSVSTNVPFVCTPIANCSNVSCTTGSDQLCLGCENSHYPSGQVCAACSGSCGAGNYQSTACTSTADRSCAPCTAIANCASGLTCTTTTDQTCGTCATGYYRNGQSCLPCSGACPAGKYQVSACSAVADRTCSNCGFMPNCATQLCTTVSNGVCQVCNANYGDCDSSTANGCETNITNNVQHCGSCGTVCGGQANATGYSCVASACQVASCNAGTADCDGLYSNGCETNTASGDINNCGGCGIKCTGRANAATYSCSASACHVATCQPGYSDQNGTYSDGCETINPPPTLASATITNASPSGTANYALSYGAITGVIPGNYTSYCILENDTTLGHCNWITGSLPANYSVTSTNNAKTLSVWIKETDLNISTRVDTNAVILDTVKPVVSGLAFNPAPSAYSLLATPTVSASVTEANSPTTTFYVSASSTPDCSGGSIGSASGTPISLQLSSVGAAGSKYIHYISADNATPSNSTACTYSGLSYLYIATPVFQLTQGSYGVNEADAGWVSATDIQVTRTDGYGHAVYDLPSTVTLTPATVVAQATAFTSMPGPIAVTFPANSALQDIGASSLNLSNTNTAVLQDAYFKASLSVADAGVVGAAAQAKVFIIDNQTSGDLMFADTLLTGYQSQGSVPVRMWRTGSTAAAASATLDFRDGSALGTTGGGTDYTSTPLTVTFPIGATEVTASIPVANHHNNSADATSFYLLLDSPSTSARPQSIAKVRILNDNDTTVCDPSNTNGAINGGFGGGTGVPGSPYLVCSTAQLANVQNNLTASYRMMADIDATTLGISTAAFSGTFDGNERIINNFNQATSNQGAAALFGMLTGTGSIQGVNLDNFALQCNKTGNLTSTCGGLIYQANNSVTDNVSLSNLYVSGYLNPTAAAVPTRLTGGGADAGVYTNYGYGMILGTTGPSSDAGTLSMTNILTAGTTNSSQAYTGNVAGYLEPGGSLALSNVLNVSHLIGTNTSTTQYIGGVAGIIDAATNESANASSTIALSNVINRGLVNNCYNGCGGVSAKLLLVNSQLGASQTVNLSNITNQGSVVFSSSQNNIAGVFGTVLFGSYNNITLSSLTNSGNIIDTITTGTLSGVAGIVGEFRPAYAPTTGATIVGSQLSNSGTIVNHGDWTGGIFGTLGVGQMLTNVSFNMSGLTNTGAVSSTSYYNGGIVGWLGSSINPGGSTATFVMNKLQNSGPVSSSYATAGGVNTGGLFGWVTLGNVPSGSGSTIQIGDNTFNSGSVTGAPTDGGVSISDSLGGLIGAANICSNGTLTISSTANRAVTATAAVSGRSAVGGVIGWLSYGYGGFGAAVDAGVSITNIESDAPVSGATSASTYAGGAIGQVTYGNQAPYANNAYLNITGFTNTGAIQQGGYVGGVIGGINVPGSATGQFTATLNSDVSTGNIESYSPASLASSNGMGGLVGNISGQSYQTVTISQSHATGNINGLNLARIGTMGGLVGAMGCGANTSCVETVTQSYATGNVTAAQSGGGLIGSYTNGNCTSCTMTIGQSYSTGTVTDNYGSSWFGGLIGLVSNAGNSAYGDLAISNSYTTSPVISTTGGSYYGGLVGRILTAGAVSIATSYASGVLSGPVSGKGFIQTNDGTLTSTNNYSLDINGADATATPLTAAQLIDSLNYPTNFAGFDFTTVPYWNPPSGTNPPTLH